MLPIGTLSRGGYSAASSRQASVLAVPGQPDEITLFVVVHVELALPGSLETLCNTARQMNIGRQDTHAAVNFFDGHDAIQGMLGLFLFLGILGEVYYLLLIVSSPAG